MYELIKRAVIEIEGNCNYNCRHCIQENTDNASMSFADYKTIIDECCELGLETVQLEGSGEATLRQDLPMFIEYAANKGIKVNIYSNGLLMNGQFMQDCVDAGLSLFRFSINGYDKESYELNTGINAFRIVLANAIVMNQYKHGVVKTYHLATKEYEVNQYIWNVISIIGAPAEIWKPHNWGGALTTCRTGEKKTCGRPFAPEITIRHNLDVYPCCQTFDKKAVLGNVKDGVLNAFNSEQYKIHRVRHRAEQFPGYCYKCDFLLKDDSVLLWSNCGQEIGKMNNVEVQLNDFSA